MSQHEETEEGLSLSGEPDSRTKAKRIQQKRPDSPEPSCVSMESYRSLDQPIGFKRQQSSETKIQQKRPDSPEPSCVSMKSDRSLDQPIGFKRQQSSETNVHHQSKEFPSDQSVQEHQTDLDSIFKLVEDNIVTFAKSELRRFQRVLSPDKQETQDEEVVESEEEEQRSSREAFLNITLCFLRRMKQEELADSLQSRETPAVCQHEHKLSLKEKFHYLFEGIAKAGNPTVLNQIYTDHHLKDGGSGEVDVEHEVRQIEAASRKPVRPEMTIKSEDIFKPLPGREKTTRTVMTKGVAGIGKTVLTQKFTLDWAEDKANQDIHFTLPFTFRELNLLKDRKFSLVELVHHFFPKIKEAVICMFNKFKVLFIFDGLDECRLPLDFQNNEILTDVTKSASVDVLLTSLIKRKLLPFAHIWMTTHPAAANQIPPDCVDMVTELRGFTDLQKEEYFRKRFRDEEQARRIILHIKSSQSLYHMCHSPLFSWISATVMEHVLKTSETELPKTLTEMYIHFLLVQSKLQNIKCHGGVETDPLWTPESRQTILSLGKLAFEQLEKGNLIFYEADLIKCGIDITAASVYSGVFTAMFKEECGLYQSRVFCFVHLSVQEFLAAVYVIISFIDSGANLLSAVAVSRRRSRSLSKKSTLAHLCQSAVDKALQSPNGHLDLFLRFLLGLSLKTNQTLLCGLLTQTGGSYQTKQKTVQYIKMMIKDNLSPERRINLFHCLNELNDHSLMEEIQRYLKSGHFSKCTHSDHWSALVFILLTSEEIQDVFDLKKYIASEEALLRLLPVVKASNKAILRGCNLSKASCESLASVLSSQSCSLTELDLSNNDLHDSGAACLSVGLKSPHCRLEILRLSGCMLTEKGCASLASALSSNPYLRELDLSYNHLGASGELFSVRREDPDWTIRLDHGGVQMLNPGLVKYACDLTLDQNTAHRGLLLSEDNRKVTTLSEKQPYPDHPERFSYYVQLLCTDGLSDRCYWEVEWTGMARIGVTCREIKRKGEGVGCVVGGNKKSWNLACHPEKYTVWHNNKSTCLFPPVSKRVAVYLDWPAGTLSFYGVSSNTTLIPIHTFHSKFTEPLYPAFGFKFRHESRSSVSLCQIKYGDQTQRLRRHSVQSQ